MSDKYTKWLKGQSAEDIAQHEFRLEKDKNRINRLHLMRMMNAAIKEKDIEAIKIIWPMVIEVIALWKRNEVSMKVEMKRQIRDRVKAEYKLHILTMSLEEYDKDYAALARENAKLAYPDKK